MEKFNLDTWLQDKSRKVVTREGKDVVIIYTNSPVPHHPIVGFIDKNIYTWTIDGKLIYGKEEQDKNDLFFADEEEILTEFEKDLQIIISEASHWTSDDGSMSTYYQFGDKEIKKISVQILDLARRELQPEFDKEMDKLLAETDKVVYQKGKQDALKSLPKDGDYDFSLKGLERELDEFFINRLAAYRRKTSKKELDDQLDAYATRLKNLVKKDLPKWKKAKENRTLPDDVVKIDEDGKIIHSDMVWEGEYFIMLQPLKSLPKEEQL